MPRQREFHIGSILSVIIGWVVDPRGIEGVMEILQFMTGEQLSLCQLRQVSKRCKPYLIKQHPIFQSPEILNEVFKIIRILEDEPDKINNSYNLAIGLFELNCKYKLSTTMYLMVEQPPGDEDTPQSPVKELGEVVPKKQSV